MMVLRDIRLDWWSKGFNRRKMIDYTYIFSLVVKLTIIQYVLSIVAIKSLHIERLDVKIAFLYGDLDGEISIYATTRGFYSEG